MPNYTNVQFLSWEVYTGPKHNAAKEPDGYAGIAKAANRIIDIASQIEDIHARVAFTEQAVIEALKISDKSPTTLKIFMAPEFLYRGAGGAYVDDLLNGWVKHPPADFNLPPAYDKLWDGLFGDLQAIAAGADYSDWLFVFGTAITAYLPVANNIDTDWIKTSGKFDFAIMNTALIQHGGPANKGNNYATQKQYKSPIDFIKYVGAIKDQFTDANVSPAESRSMIPEDVFGEIEGSAVFNIPGINDSTGQAIDFGVEVCLDHAVSGGNGKNEYGRIRTANQWVRIQLVPSAGMELVEDSIRLKQPKSATNGCYAFNCDGLGFLSTYEYGAHTQIWNGGVGGVLVKPANKLVEVNNGKPAANTTVAVVPNMITISGNQLDASTLWHDGTNGSAGYIRASAVLPL